MLSIGDYREAPEDCPDCGNTGIFPEFEEIHVDVGVGIQVFEQDISHPCGCGWGERLMDHVRDAERRVYYAAMDLVHRYDDQRFSQEVLMERLRTAAKKVSAAKIGYPAKKVTSADQSRTP